MEIDSTYLQQVRTDPHYNYLEELGQKTETVTTQPDINIGSSINQFFYDNRELIEFCSYIVVAAILAMIVYSIWKRYSPSFEAEDTPSGMGTDTIYNHDWEPEINQMMSSGKYSEAVVLCYLRWLDDLNTNHVIAFSQSKTPEIFMKEVTDYAKKSSDDNLITKTRRLTDQYLLVRYGHRKATKALAEEMIAL